VARTKAPTANARAWLRDLGSGAIIGLATLYGVGCLVRLGQFRELDVDTGAVFPLVPLPQILLLDVSKTLVLGLAVATTLLIAVLVGVPLHERRDESKDKLTLTQLIILFAAVAVLIALVAPPAISIPVAAYLAAPCAVLVRARIAKSSDPTLGGFVAIGFTAGGLVLAGWQLAAPQPLPRVEISTKSRGVVQGQLLVRTESNWYVLRRGSNITATPDDDVTWNNVSAPEPSESTGPIPSLFD
jgi:hypothetical protein